MADLSAWPWMGLFGLGLWHGINPAMGWLFAVALGMQEQRGRAVWRALAPLALGHAISIGAAVLLAALVGLVVHLVYLKWAVAALLVGWGVCRLVRNRHPRWVRMRVGPRDLVLWSMLMASAHGAGVMVLPFALGAEPVAAVPPARSGAAYLRQPSHRHSEAPNAEAPGDGTPAITTSSPRPLGFWVAVVHTAGYLLATGLLAVLVYEKLGLRMLRSAWVNLDVIWAVALILTGAVTPLL